MKPQFSIIVPVYNTGAYLRKCVDSLLGQTLHNIEVILVNDGSTDNSGEICDSYRSDERVKVIHKQNQGQGIARNAGLDIAEGEYVLFIDSDDYIEKISCEILYDYMQKKQVQLCCFGYMIEDGDGREVYRTKMSEQLYRGNEIKERFILHFFGDSPEEDELRGVSACMTAFKREVIERHQIRFPSERKVLSEDTVFNLEFCKHIDAAAALPIYIYHYLQNSTSFSHAYRPDRFSMTVKLCDILKDYAGQYGISEKVDIRIQMVLWVSLMECIKQEVRRTDVSKKIIWKNVDIMCRDERTQTAVKKLCRCNLGIKQMVLLYAIRAKWTGAAIWMAAIRNRRGL